MEKYIIRELGSGALNECKERTGVCIEEIKKEWAPSLSGSVDKDLLRLEIKELCKIIKERGV